MPFPAETSLRNASFWADSHPASFPEVPLCAFPLLDLYVTVLSFGGGAASTLAVAIAPAMVVVGSVVELRYTLDAGRRT